jgi:hypothetical protein
MVDVLELREEPGQTLIITPGFEDTDRDARFERACEMYPDAQLEMDEAGNIVVTPETVKIADTAAERPFGNSQIVD